MPEVSTNERSTKQGSLRFNAMDLVNLEAESYDGGTLIEVFEHIPPAECQQFASLLARSLKRSAPLVVTVPSTEKPVTAKHYRHFNFSSLKQCFDGHIFCR
jgi:predicted SAM-dependent methyltransferase